MQITVRLFASLCSGRFKERVLYYPPGTDVGRIVEDLGIPEHHLGTILINGVHREIDSELSPGDTLWILPVLAGG